MFRFRNLVRGVWLVAVTGVLMGGWQVARAERIDEVMAAAESAKQRVQVERDALFGPSGSLQWLLQGISGPAGEPDTNPVIIREPITTLDTGTYVSLEKEAGAVQLDPSMQSFDIQTQGALRNVLSKGVDEGSAKSEGMNATCESQAGLAGVEIDGAIHNSGTIYAGADVHNAAVSQAAGAVFACSLSGQPAEGDAVAIQGSFINDGTVYAKAAGGLARPIGVYHLIAAETQGLGDAMVVSQIGNNGRIYTEADGSIAMPYGLMSFDQASASGGGNAAAVSQYANSGTIDVRASGAAGALGAFSIGMGTNNMAEAADGADALAASIVGNRGTMRVEAAGEASAAAFGIYTLNRSETEGGGNAQAINAVSNSGTIYIASNGAAAAAGPIVSQSLAGATGGGSAKAISMIDNSGILYAEGRAGEESDQSVGITAVLEAAVDGAGQAATMSIIDNSGAVYAANSGTASSACGIDADIETRAVNGGHVLAMNSVNNSGQLFARANGAFSEAYGIYSSLIADPGDQGDLQIQGDLSNSGTIDARATGDSAGAYGIYMAGDGSVANTGTITVDAAAGAGIAIESGSASIANSGYIYAYNGARSLEIGSAEMATTAQATLDGADFQLVFSGDPTADAYAAPILLHPGSTLDLAGVRLVAAPGEAVAWDTPYGVIENDAGTVTHAFGGLGLPNPNIAVTWAGSDNAAHAAVSFGYAPEKSAAAAAPVATRTAVAGADTLVRNRMSAMALSAFLHPGDAPERLLVADSGAIVSDAGTGYGHRASTVQRSIFFKPYFTKVDLPADGKMGFDTENFGFVAGYEGFVSPDLLLGLHGGLSKLDIDYTGTGYAANSEDVDLFSLGAHGAYSVDNWHVQASTTVYAARHDYYGMTGADLDLPEQDSYASYGSETALTAGYGLRFGAVGLMPEVGLAHDWMHGESHTTETASAEWQTHYGSYDEHVFKSILGVRATGSWAVGGGRIAPALGLRWEQALNDASIAVSQSLPGTNSIDVSQDVGDTSILTDVSLQISQKNVSVTLGYVHEYNDAYTADAGSITFRSAF